MSVHLQLAGVIRLALAQSRGPKDAFVFDPHRLALPCWALALEGARSPALLITLDRHLDLVPPERLPPPGADALALDTYARRELDVRNVSHVLAAMEAGLVGDALVIARARPRGCLEAPCYRDAQGREHRLRVAPTVDRLLEDAEPLEWVQRADRILLDVDLDCFTSPSDADPTTVLPWPRAIIREHVLPRGSETFWSAVLPRTAALTVAREPSHCGGLLASNRLFEDAAEVVFRELLGAELP